MGLPNRLEKFLVLDRESFEVFVAPEIFKNLTSQSKTKLSEPVAMSKESISAQRKDRMRDYVHILKTHASV